MYKNKPLNDRDTITGPYYNFSNPYGPGSTTCRRNVWYVSRQLTPGEYQSEITRILGGRVCLGVVTRFHGQQRRYVIVHNNNIQEFPSLARAVAFLTEKGA